MSRVLLFLVRPLMALGLWIEGRRVRSRSVDRFGSGTSIVVLSVIGAVMVYVTLHGPIVVAGLGLYGAFQIWLASIIVMITYLEAGRPGSLTAALETALGKTIRSGNNVGTTRGLAVTFGSVVATVLFVYLIRVFHARLFGAWEGAGTVQGLDLIRQSVDAVFGTRIAVLHIEGLVPSTLSVFGKIMQVFYFTAVIGIHLSRARADLRE